MGSKVVQHILFLGLQPIQHQPHKDMNTDSSDYTDALHDEVQEVCTDIANLVKDIKKKIVTGH